MMDIKRKSLGCRATVSTRAVLIAGLLATTTPLAAQTTSNQPGTSANSGSESEVLLDDIIVTARKRDESLQNVPISIGVVTPAAIANSGSASLLQLETVVPGLNLTKAPTGNSVGVTIRGLGSAPGDPSFESSVSLFVDGVYAPRAREFSSALFDVERVEVIKGTQAALLGKNTSLGALNVITRKPGSKLAFNARVAYDFELGSRTVEAGADIPIADTLRLRVAGQSVFDGGWVLNTLINHVAARTYNDSLRMTFVWEPTESIDVTGSYQYGKARSSGTPAELISVNPTAGFLQAVAGAPGTLDFALDRRNASALTGLIDEQSDSLRTHRASLVANFGFGDFTVTSVTGYSTFRNVEANETDFVAGNYLRRDNNEYSRQLSQELRLVSPSNQALEYVVGATYIDNKLDTAALSAANYPFGPPVSPTTPIAGAFNNGFVQNTDTLSAFAQASFRVTDNLRIQGGVRYTNEKKKADLSRTIVKPGLFSVFIYPPFAPFTLQKTENNLDYSVGVQYDVADNVMVYASFGQGTKAGGFASSVTNLAQSPYSPERAQTAEVGIKAQDASRRWTFNAAVFNSDVRDFQVVTFNGQTFVVTNANLRSRGVEIEAAYAPVRGVRAYVNATYADVKDKGTKLDIPLAPRLAGNAGVSVRQELGESGVAGILDLSVNHRSSRTYQQDPAVPRGAAFTTVNLSLGITDVDDRWEVRLIGRNLTDKNAASFVFPVPIIGGYAGVSERPRTIALQGSVNF
jgi:iron complex outermembrane recepter protein